MWTTIHKCLVYDILKEGMGISSNRIKDMSSLKHCFQMTKNVGCYTFRELRYVSSDWNM